MVFVLIVVKGPSKGQVIQIADADRWVIGRMREQGQRVIWVPDAKVSRRHAELFCRDDVWYIRDLGSTNGTHVNHQLLVDSEEPRALHDGDQIAMGTTVMVAGHVDAVASKSDQPAVAPAPVAAPQPEEPKEASSVVGEMVEAPQPVSEAEDEVEIAAVEADELSDEAEEDQLPVASQEGDGADDFVKQLEEELAEDDEQHASKVAAERRILFEDEDEESSEESADSDASAAMLDEIDQVDEAIELADEAEMTGEEEEEAVLDEPPRPQPHIDSSAASSSLPAMMEEADEEEAVEAEAIDEERVSALASADAIDRKRSRGWLGGVVLLLLLAAAVGLTYQMGYWPFAVESESTSEPTVAQVPPSIDTAQPQRVEPSRSSRPPTPGVLESPAPDPSPEPVPATITEPSTPIPVPAPSEVATPDAPDTPASSAPDASAEPSIASASEPAPEPVAAQPVPEIQPSRETFAAAPQLPRDDLSSTVRSMLDESATVAEAPQEVETVEVPPAAVTLLPSVPRDPPPPVDLDQPVAAPRSVPSVPSAREPALVEVPPAVEPAPVAQATPTVESPLAEEATPPPSIDEPVEQVATVEEAADDLLDDFIAMVEGNGGASGAGTDAIDLTDPSYVQKRLIAARRDNPGDDTQPVPLRDAARVVFVIDASGAQVDTLPLVLERVSRTIALLREDQQFTVIFFQGDRVIEVPPVGFKRATHAVRREVSQWVDPGGGRIVAMGASNPVRAIQQAVEYKPDQMFVYSDRIAGPRANVEEHERVLDLLDELDPQREIQINGVQFFYQDPLHTLRLITERHHGIYEFIAQPTSSAR